MVCFHYSNKPGSLLWYFKLYNLSMANFLGMGLAFF